MLLHTCTVCDALYRARCVKSVNGQTGVCLSCHYKQDWRDSVVSVRNFVLKGDVLERIRTMRAKICSLCPSRGKCMTLELF
jgi:hypothetical protein